MGCTESKVVRTLSVRRLSKGQSEEDDVEHYSLKEHLVLQRKSSKRHHSFRNVEAAIAALERKETNIKVDGIVSDWDAAKLGKAIAVSDSVKSVSVEFDVGVECTANGIRSVARAVISSPVVENFRVSGGGNSAAIVIGDILESQVDTSAMHRVHLASGGKIFADGLTTLAFGIKENSKIKELKLPICQLDDADVNVLAENGFKYSASLMSLDLSNNQITNVGFENLAAAMSESKLQILNIKNNSISDASAALKLHDLRELRVGRNELKNNLVAIAELLERNQLDCLDLETNQITADGISVICTSLPKATRLLELNLSGNVIGDNAAKLLIENLPSNIQVLALRACSLSSSVSQFLAGNLHRFTKLRALDLSDNNLGNEGVTDVLNTMKDHLRIEAISFDRDRSLIVNDIVPVVLQRLSMHRTLATINFRGLSLTEENQERIRSMLVNLRSDRARIMTLMCCALTNPRKNTSKCVLGSLPIELVRELSKFLYF